ncbi:UNVERIFIED_CONTAM: site-specific integrase, partial [Bacteroidetes bacterium 56_B9]
NPMKLLKNPRTIKDDKQEELIYYSKEELQQFLEYAKKEEPSDYPIFRSLAFTGLRKGELAALLWSDIDFDRLELTVS